MDLFIVRHAWAGAFGDPAWPDDSERPLTDEGRRRFARMVENLADRGLVPQLIATSPLVRCRQTAEILAEGVRVKPKVVPRDELAPGGDAESLVAWTDRQTRDYQQIAWVGHMPDVDHLAATLIGRGSASVHFSKGAIAAIRFEDSLRRGQGELRWLVTAKVLGV